MNLTICFQNRAKLIEIFYTTDKSMVTVKGFQTPILLFGKASRNKRKNHDRGM